MRRAALAAALLSAPAPLQAAEEPLLWRLTEGRVDAAPFAPTGPLRVGSLQKPFVVRAWAETHTSEETPRLRCPGGVACWLRAGHGALGLVHATSLSCNVYFRALAEQTPPDVLARVLEEEGFTVEAPLTPDTAIGLPDPAGHARAATRPGELLAAYGRLAREPWAAHDDVRRELLAGLRAAALDGTASGLGARTYYAKTGTAPSVDGRPLQTSGMAVAVDATGSGVFALVRRGTGREASDALSAALRARAARAASAAHPRVRVALFSLLRPRRIIARNVSGTPLPDATGFVGAGAEVELRAGQRLAEGLWELRLPEWRLTRRLRAAIEADGLPNGVLEVVAEMDPFEYVAGVAAAELPTFERERLVALGGAVLRFLAEGRRHALADVCDSTHCAFYVGRGPRAEWPSRWTARLAAFAPPEMGPHMDPDLIAEIRSQAARPGPSHWTSHCGGEPLSARFVWGSGSEARAPCPHHHGSETRPWRRLWADSDVAAALEPLRGLRVATDGGVWRLQADTPDGRREWLYDEAHRLLAGRLGWGSLPSPADSVSKDGAGFVAAGRGLGHRVGLCLSE